MYLGNQSGTCGNVEIIKGYLACMRGTERMPLVVLWVLGFSL